MIQHSPCISSCRRVKREKRNWCQNYGFFFLSLLSANLSLLLCKSRMACALFLSSGLFPFDMSGAECSLSLPFCFCTLEIITRRGWKRDSVTAIPALAEEHSFGEWERKTGLGKAVFFRSIAAYCAKRRERRSRKKNRKDNTMKRSGRKWESKVTALTDGTKTNGNRREERDEEIEDDNWICVRALSFHF